MAYIKLVIFEIKENMGTAKIDNVEFDNCEWGWLVKDEELEKINVDGETEFRALLHPDEATKRFEKNIADFEATKISEERYAKWYLENTEKPDHDFLKRRKSDLKLFEKLIYDKRIVRIIFHKYWNESGLN